jgi:hypothetical protein
MDDASGPAGASRGYNTRQLHVMAPRLVEQTIERAGITSLGGSYAIGPFPNHTGSIEFRGVGLMAPMLELLANRARVASMDGR